MGIYKGSQELTARHNGNRVAVAVYRGARLVWQSVRSCFGSGGWINEKPWLDDEGWKN